MAHSSVSMEFIPPDTLDPVETMEPYEPCWCRSGRKFKFCHFRRDRQTPLNVFEVEARLMQEMREGYCSYPDRMSDSCSGKIAKAHTVQRNGGLAAIAEDGHVLTVKPIMKDMIASDGKPEPRRIGVGNASVFPGFCGKHDTSVFRPVEGRTVIITKETAFLLAYRAIAYERFAKVKQETFNERLREADRGKPFPVQAALQSYLHDIREGVRLGVRDVNRWKGEFDARLLSRDLTDFHYAAVWFDEVLPIVACSAFFPEFDLEGRALQKLGRGFDDLEHITMTVTSFDKRSVVVFGWVGPADGTAETLANSYLAVPDERKADALVRLLFVHTDNLFLRPSWWASLSASDQAMYHRLITSGVGMQPRLGRELVGDGISTVSVGVKNSVTE